RVGTFIFERPRPLSRQRRADDLYTLNCEEPVNGLQKLALALSTSGQHRNMRVLLESFVVVAGY
ncbi:hypothetical protein SBE55_23730, partial [Mycolicibacterium sp. 141076]|uniref:hypothetical protein n=1 Tax=Mycolicibacterium sp. 141076 TaxID=3090599 RepID=UPI00299E43D9